MGADDIEIIEQWSEWLDDGDEDSLRRDFREVLTHPERCQPPELLGPKS